MDEIEDAVALMARALRQGKWEQSMTHADLVPFLREETEELAEVIDQVAAGYILQGALDRLRAGGLPPGGTLLVCVDPVLGPDVHAELLAGTAAYAETVTIGADGNPAGVQPFTAG